MADKFHRALIKKADAKGLEGKARKKFIADGLAKDTRTLDRQIRAKRGATTIRKAFKGRGALSSVKKLFNRKGSS